jgi:hypothetical protein
VAQSRPWHCCSACPASPPAIVPYFYNVEVGLGEIGMMMLTLAALLNSPGSPLVPLSSHSWLATAELVLPALQLLFFAFYFTIFNCTCHRGGLYESCMFSADPGTAAELV